MKVVVILAATLLLLAGPVLMAPSATAHEVCVGDACNCPPGNPGTHVHVNTADPNACAQLR